MPVACLDIWVVCNIFATIKSAVINILVTKFLWKTLIICTWKWNWWQGKNSFFRFPIFIVQLPFRKIVPSYNLININSVWEYVFAILSPTLRHKLLKWVSLNYLNLFWKCWVWVSERITLVGIEAGEHCNMPYSVWVTHRRAVIGVRTFLLSDFHSSFLRGLPGPGSIYKPREVKAWLILILYLYFHCS